MQNKHNLWALHNLGVAYGRPPSAYLEVEDAWLAYQLDLACLTFGRWVENKLSERDKKGRRIHRLEKLLAPQEAPCRDGAGLADETATRRRFRDPRGLVRRKVKVGPDGTW